MRTDTHSPELRKEFVEQLHVLFDILDTSRTGRISYETLCARFTEVHKPHLPPSFLRCVGKVASADGYLTFDRFLTAVKLSLRDSEINNNIPLQRVQSEGRIDNLTAERRKMHNDPSMGINDFYRRTQLHYGSQPNINPNDNTSRVIPVSTSPAATSRPPSYSNYMNLNFDANSPKPPNVVLRPKKVRFRSFCN
ncbi:unnamed protein product [Auanema sp. JU1783]|nr:unnamed protein product [Auanema sp. JU1783]